MAFHPDWLRPEWRIEGIQSVMTTRRGGFSTGLFDSMNLRDGLGDDVRSVALNQRRLSESIGVSPIYLNQVHGHRVVRLTSTNAAAGAPRHEADACMTTEPGVVCAVQVADCMPVLFAAPGAVAAAHAGWRGLAAGILDTTLDALCLAAGCVPGQVEAWLGPCIGPRRFEVGADVLQAFGCTPTSLPAADDPVEAPRFTPTKPGKWLANLPRLARERLVARGVVSISGGTWCSVEEASRFFSFRRDGVTGRMVAAIWLTV